MTTRIRPFALAALSAALLLTSPALRASSVPGAADLGGGFFRSDWFGTYFQLQGDYINHQEHGLLFVSPQSEGVWFFDPKIPAWIFSSATTFPLFYVHAGQPFFAYYLSGEEGPMTTPRVFLSLRTFAPLYLPRANGDIVDAASRAGVFNTLLTAATTAGLADDLMTPGPLTVFAPTDTAFNDLGTQAINNLLLEENRDQLIEILSYHVVPAYLPASRLSQAFIGVTEGGMADGYLRTLAGQDLYLQSTPQGVFLDGMVNVVTPNVFASNGVVHVIDTVLMPPQGVLDVATAAGLTTLRTAIEASTIPTFLANNPDATLTVFAPTNDAFAEVADLNDILNNQMLLDSILQYHIVEGRIYSSEVTSGTVTTLQGGTLTLEVDGGVTINPATDDAEVEATDVRATNIVIHVIDTVLIPPGS